MFDLRVEFESLKMLELWISCTRFNPISTADDRLITGTTLVLAAAEQLRG